MKESKLIELKNKVDRLGKVVQALINEVQANATLVQGTLTAFQLHIGKDEWEKVVAELKERCKAAGLPVGGKKADLIDRLSSSQSSEEE